MLPVTIEKQLTIAARAATVWRFIGTEEGLRQWWGREITLEARQGGRCEEHTVWHGRLCHWRGEVTVYAPPLQLALLLRKETATETDDGWPAWVTISITLREQNGETCVTLHQQAYGPWSGEAVSNALVPLPTMPGGPQPIWNSLQRPVGLSRGVQGTGGCYAVALDPAWQTQSASQWDTCLQTLAHQVLLRKELRATPEK